MTYFLLKNVKRVSCYKFLPKSFLKQPFNLTISSITNNNVQSRNFSFLGLYSSLSQSTPVVSLQSLLFEFHQVSGLPWWSVIMLTTLSIRSLIVFPLTVHQHQVISRLAKINTEMGKIASDLNIEVNVARKKYKWTEDYAKKVFQNQLKKIYNGNVVRDNCHPFKITLLVLIQVPIWVCFSVSLRNLTYVSSALDLGVESMDLNFKTEGVLWFTDLTCPDPIFIPLLLMVVNFSLIEIHALRQIRKETLFQKIILNGSRLIAVVVAAAATVNPASVTFYWLCSSTFGIAQSLILISPTFRKILRIPRMEKESVTPFSDIASNFKKRFKL